MILRILAIQLLLTLIATAQLPLQSEHVFGSSFRGGSIAMLGDVNGDGWGDYVTGPTLNVSLPLQVRSGRDSSVIYTVSLPPGASYFGYELTALGDLDGDGITDFVSSGGHGVAILVISGASGAALNFVASVPGWPGFGRQALPLGDLDADGITEVAISWTGTAQVQTAGFAIYSGANGTLIRSQGFPQNNVQISALGDVDADGVPDLGAVHETAAAPFSVARRFEIFSGADGSLLFSTLITSNFDVPTDSAGIGDVDGDGYDDFVLGLNGAFNTAPGRVAAFSGQTGLQLWSHLSGANHRLGGLLYRSADVNGDGVLDVIALDEKTDESPVRKSVVVLSGTTGGLIADFSPAGGAYGRLDVDAGDDVNGDGFADLAYANRDGVIARCGVFSTTGALRYGGNMGGLQTLDLSWTPGPMNARHIGSVVSSGASANAMGVGYVTWAAGSSVVSGLPVLLDTNPANLALQATFNFDAAGQFATVVDLKNPALAGNTLYVQHFAFTAPLAASNGLQLLFSN